MAILNGELDTIEEKDQKEVPVHIRLFGKKPSPRKNKDDKKEDNVYKSNNRDWQKGLR